jgi:hypothetical protein
MCLHPQPDYPIPEETRRVTLAAFPNGTFCLHLVEALGSLYRDISRPSPPPFHGSMARTSAYRARGRASAPGSPGPSKAGSGAVPRP